MELDSNDTALVLLAVKHGVGGDDNNQGGSRSDGTERRAFFCPETKALFVCFKFKERQ